MIYLSTIYVRVFLNHHPLQSGRHIWAAPGSCYLQPRSLLDRKIHQQGLVLQFTEGLEGHEFVVGLGGPGVDLDGVAQRDDEELDSLVLDDLEMDRALEVADVDPAGAPLDGIVCPQNLRLEPREIIDPHSVLLAWNFSSAITSQYVLLVAVGD